MPVFEALIFYAVFLFSTTLHEAGHAWVAKKGGDLTAYMGGQVSINPMPHIRREPVGMVVLPLLFVFISGWPFGFASAPYDPHWARRYPGRAALMSLAGPSANMLIVLSAALLMRVGVGMGWFEAPMSVHFSQVTSGASTMWGGFAFVLSVFFSLNLVLFILNIMPVPPLDGSGTIPWLLGPHRTLQYQRIFHQPMIGWVGILVAWRVFDFVWLPCFLFAVNLLYPGANYG